MRIHLQIVNTNESQVSPIGKRRIYTPHDDNKRHIVDLRSVCRSRAWSGGSKCRTGTRILQFFYLRKIAPCPHNFSTKSASLETTCPGELISLNFERLLKFLYLLSGYFESPRGRFIGCVW
jgi:hypothetical protein